MPMIIKLTVFSVLNMAGLVWLLINLIKSQRTPVEALAITWRMIVAGCRNFEPKGKQLPDGVFILQKTWWLMLVMQLFCWITQPDTGFGYLGLSLIIFHLGWFLLSRSG
ncbi:MAG TPA: hypothetical protein VEC37_10945, partial [Bacillota bacterium]|nr:hypothetical protein [Bacillota bacterium]